MTEPLLVVLASPPITAGTRTRSAVDIARLAIGAERADCVNLFSLPTQSVLDITSSGSTSAPWLEARPSILAGLATASRVLLAYGVSEPAGDSRMHHRDQLRWLRQMLKDHGMSKVLTFGGRARHPSRWQRYTSRAHPECSFADAVGKSLANVALSELGPQLAPLARASNSPLVRTIWK